MTLRQISNGSPIPRPFSIANPQPKGSSPLDRATLLELRRNSAPTRRSGRTLCFQSGTWCGFYRGPSGSMLSASRPKKPYHMCAL